jgi:hypothetical protein
MTGDRAQWLLGHLRWAAEALDVQLAGEPRHDRRLRAAGVRVLDHGAPAWLRVVFDDPEWGRGSYLDGAVTANDIRGVPKPTVMRWHEWDDDGRHMRGELSTYVQDPTIADDTVLTSPISISDSWLASLRDALTALEQNPVPPHGVDLEDVSHGAQAYFGIALDPTKVRWTAAHCDLHWGNVTVPTFVIIDWEIWGRAPAGYDAATLYCTSLLQPAVSRRIWQSLASFLDTPDGRLATIAAAVRLLRFVDAGEYLALARPLRAHVHEIAAMS